MNPKSRRNIMSRQVQKIRVGMIDPDPNQPRKTKSPEYLKELGKSIAADGLNNPIALRPHPEISGRYMIVNGECRWAACLLAGIEEIDSFVRIKKYAAMSESDLLIHQIADNEQRSDMLPIETAEAYARAVELGATIKEISEKTGKSEKTISCDVKIAGLPKICKDAINAGTLSKTVGEKIASFDTEKQMTTAYKKSMGKGTVLDQLAAVEAYRQRNAQGTLALGNVEPVNKISNDDKREAGNACAWKC
jgi:ParB family chromosome partitioning protein